MPTNPINGMINCSLGDDGVPSYEDTCIATCDTGYMLTGDAMRTCQSDGIFNGTEAMCNRGKVYTCFILCNSFKSVSFSSLFNASGSYKWSHQLFTGR